MFYSGNFTYDGKYNDEYDIYLVSEKNDILNEYGINFTEDKEITLTFCYSNEYGEALEWNSEVLALVHGWFITDEYKPFTSEDNEELIYFLKGKSISKRFTSAFTGLIDVTFELYSNYAYVSQVTTVKVPTDVTIFNCSNLKKAYKPILKMSNINSNAITLKHNSKGSQGLVLDNLTNVEEIIVDNEFGVVTDSNENNLMKHCNRNWLELNQGNNSISITGDCSLTIECLYPMMM